MIESDCKTASYMIKEKLDKLDKDKIIHGLISFYYQTIKKYDNTIDMSRDDDFIVFNQILATIKNCDLSTLDKPEKKVFDYDYGTSKDVNKHQRQKNYTGD